MAEINNPVPGVTSPHILINLRTGEPVRGANIHAPIHTASTSKIGNVLFHAQQFGGAGAFTQDAASWQKCISYSHADTCVWLMAKDLQRMGLLSPVEVAEAHSLIHRSNIEHMRNDNPALGSKIDQLGSNLINQAMGKLPGIQRNDYNITNTNGGYWPGESPSTLSPWGASKAMKSLYDMGGIGFLQMLGNPNDGRLHTATSPAPGGGMRHLDEIAPTNKNKIFFLKTGTTRANSSYARAIGFYGADGDPYMLYVGGSSYSEANHNARRVIESQSTGSRADAAPVKRSLSPPGAMG